LKELERTFAEVYAGDYRYVRCFGLHGTYDDGLEWLQQPENLDKPKTLLWLGSSIGNFTRSDASSFLSAIAAALKSRDQLIVGIDACKHPERVFHAYNDRDGVTHDFILNGLRHANTLLGNEVFEEGQWLVHGEYDAAGGRHQAFVYPVEDVVVNGVPIRKGERFRIEQSHKYSPDESQRLWEEAGIIEGARWTNSAGDYGELVI
jgi:L-histidine Nalpha-methyltransferase / hercynylcysteine S-oxide synthase